MGETGIAKEADDSVGELNEAKDGYESASAAGIFWFCEGNPGIEAEKDGTGKDGGSSA